MYCVYETTYSGKLMPAMYIGSSSVKNVKNGYHGSVLSKKYKDIWLSELKHNPQLFSTKILVIVSTRNEALEIEYKYQKAVNAIKSPNYINMGYATKGFFGSNVKGENNPFYGKHHSDDTKSKLRGPRPHTSGKNNHFHGKTHSIETVDKIISKSRLSNPCEINGVKYLSLNRAAQALGVSKYFIKKMINGTATA